MSQEDKKPEKNQERDLSQESKLPENQDTLTDSSPGGGNYQIPEDSDSSQARIKPEETEPERAKTVDSPSLDSGLEDKTTSKSQKKSKKKKKGFFGFLGSLVVWIGIVLGLVVGGLTAQYFLTIQKPVDYLPSDYLVYLQIPSLKEVYEDWIDLEAVDIVLSEEGMDVVRDGLLQFKSLDLSDNFFFKQLLDVELNLMVLPPDRPLIVFELGWRSALTRQLPLLTGLVPIEGLREIREGGNTYFVYTLESEPSEDTQQAQEPGEEESEEPQISQEPEGEGTSTSFAFAFLDNLVLASTDEEAVKAALIAGRTGEGFSSTNEEETLSRLASGASGSLRILSNTQALLDQNLNLEGKAGELMDALSFTDDTYLTLDLDDLEFRFKAEASLEASHEVLDPIIDFRPIELEGIRSLPASTYYYTAANVANFRDLMDLALFLEGENLEGILGTVNDASNLVFGIGVEELLFDWIGTEVGVFGLSGVPDPIFYLRIGDRGKFERTMAALTNSMILEGDESLVLDGVQIDRIKLPDFLNFLLESFGVQLALPYHITRGDLLFLSMNPEPLAILSRDRDQGNVLIQSEEFKAISQDVSLDPHLFMYYDLNQATPFFAQGNSVMAQILRLYSKGLVSLHGKDGDWELEINAIKSQRTGARDFPGYPRPWAGSGAEALVDRFPGKGDPWIVYLDRTGTLRTESLSGKEIFTAQVEPGSQIVPGGYDGNGEQIMVLGARDTLYLFDLEGNPVEGYPQNLGFVPSFLPLGFDGELVLFEPDSRVLLYRSRGGETRELGFEFRQVLRSRPDRLDNYLSFYPKTFDGSVYLTDPEGESLPGWPARGGGISLGKPHLVRYQGRVYVAFLSQRGILNLWDVAGSPVPGYPIQLPGVYFQDLVTLTRMDGEFNAFVTLNKEGLLSLIAADGRTLAQELLSGTDGEDARILVEDVTGDRVDEIFVYGDSNFIRGYDWNLNELEGFPVRGSGTPKVIDVNLDGTSELVTTSFDGNIYVYTMDF